MSSKDTSFSGSHGKAKKPLQKDGEPKLKTGTPSYIKNAADAAARKTDFAHSNHREHVSSRAGTPERRADPRIARAGRDRDEA